MEQLLDPDEFTEQLDQSAQHLKVPRVKASIDEARAFYGWTAHKLDILGLYLKQYRRVAGNGSYVDAFAGTGQISVDGQMRPGSVGVAAGSGAFKEMLLYERAKNARCLKAWVAASLSPKTASRCTIRSGDSNLTLPEDLDAGRIPYDKPCFALLDPDSTELNWSTVVRLANYKQSVSPPKVCRIELWVLLNTHQVLMRLMPKLKRPHAEVLDRWFGDRAAWWDLYQDRQPPVMFAVRYADRLKALGYGAAVPLLISDPKTRRPQYYMIHASDHPAAHSFMAWASRKTGDDDVEEMRLPGFDC